MNRKIACLFHRPAANRSACILKSGRHGLRRHPGRLDHLEHPRRPGEAESAGGLIVAAIQFAIALGAASGGILFDTAGASGVYVYGGAVLMNAWVLIALGVCAPAAATA